MKLPRDLRNISSPLMVREVGIQNHAGYSSSSMTFAEHVSRYMASAATDKFQVVSGCSAIEFGKLPTSVVFLHAVWSGPSVKALKAYIAAFVKLHAATSVRFYIVNVDDLADEFIARLPGVFGGNGETFFVREGKIVGNIPHFSDQFSDQLKAALGVG